MQNLLGHQAPGQLSSLLLVALQQGVKRGVACRPQTNRTDALLSTVTTLATIYAHSCAPEHMRSCGLLAHPAAARRTTQQPGSLVAAHLVSLARTAEQTLSQLLLLGADAPIAQQQLAYLQQQQQQQHGGSDSSNKKRSQQQQQPDCLANGTAADTGTCEPTQDLRHLEARALGRTWRAVCAPALTGFDALILLRTEALPFADRCDPLAVQQLQLLVAQQRRQQRRLAAGKKQQHRQQHGVLQLLLGGHGGGGVKCAVPKNARAVMGSIPEQVRRLGLAGRFMILHTCELFAKQPKQVFQLPCLNFGLTGFDWWLLILIGCQ